MKYLITGGAGFIGSHLVDALLRVGKVIVLDNGSSCGMDLIGRHFNDPGFYLITCSLETLDRRIVNAFKDVDVVFHLAANPDARRGNSDTWWDLEQETIVTRNVLEAMRRANCKRIVFASSGTVYGDLGGTVATEDMGPLLPASLYGAGKLASEGLISAFCGTFGMSAMILRLGNVIGPRLTHGCIFDFLKQLKADPTTLKVLGNGYQSKPYVHVSDVVEGMVWAAKELYEGRQCRVFNLASDGSTSVREIIRLMAAELKLDFKTVYGTDPIGWPGDIACALMSYWRLYSAMGRKNPPASDQVVKRAIKEICANVA